MAYEIDRPFTAPTEPSIADMTRVGLATLKRRAAAAGKGFFAMIEGSHIDFCGHANDPACLPKCVLCTHIVFFVFGGLLLRCLICPIYLLSIRVDIGHALHLYSEVAAFDDAISVVFDFVRQNPQTTVVITADHETGTCFRM